MTTKLHVAPRPCNTCPYARSTPPGVWAPEEYAKLSRYDRSPETNQDLATFHCHQENATGVPTVCRGWLSVHADGPAVRLAVIRGAVGVDDIPPEPEPDLYASGAEAEAAGLAGVAEPDARARRAIEKLVRRGAGRYDDDPDGEG